MTKMVKKAPYTSIAKIYDYLMEDIDYKIWMDLIEEIFTHFEAKPKTILELGCGTGNICAELESRGYKMTGIDLASEMIDFAKTKIQSVNFQVADMRDFHFEEKFDAVLCLFDSINYVHTLEEILQVLDKTYEVLKEGGIFIFDISTELNSIQNFNGYYEAGEFEGIQYTFESFYLRSEKMHLNEITLELPGHPETFVEKHFQKVFKTKEMQELVENSKFEVLGIFDGFEIEEAAKESERVNFVLRKQ